MDQDGGAGNGGTLQVHEVTQGLVEFVQAVNERQVERDAAQDLRQCAGGEEVVTGALEDRCSVREAGRYGGRRVDADDQCLRQRQRQGTAASHADLDVRTRSQVAVYLH
jgi:hypothetical protein